MKRATRVILIILAVLVVIIGIVTFFERDNFIAFYNSRNNSLDEIEIKLHENSVRQENAVSGLAVRMLTDEEKKEIKNGTLNSTDALGRIVETQTIEDTADAEGENNSVDGNSSPQTGSSAKTNYDAQLSELIGQIYVLEATYSGAIENLMSSAVAEYKALPPNLHTDANKWNIGAKYLGTASSMESNCDRQMASILSKIENVLISSGKDMSLLSKIKNAYESEKSLKKEYYLSMYS